MKILDVKYEDIDKTTGALEESGNPDELWEEEMIQDETTGNDAIFTCGPAWRVTDRNLIFMEGVYCNYNEETKEYDPDWSLTLIYEDTDDEKFDAYEYVYFEQDPPAVSIHNYLRAIELRKEHGKRKRIYHSGHLDGVRIHKSKRRNLGRCRKERTRKS